MSNGECSICLAVYKDPVCIPCGHIYCTRCLADHVNASDDILQSTCPTCRTTFTTATPDLTYLPKKYHQYVLPCVRRVYLDSSVVSDLQKKLAKANIRIKRLENDQAILMKECERHMSASLAHRNQERDALERVEELEEDLAGSDILVVELRGALENALRAGDNDHEELDQKYQKLKRHYQKLRQQLEDRSRDIDQDNNTSAVVYDFSASQPSRGSRKIRPLPRKAQENSSHSSNAKRPRLSV